MPGPIPKPEDQLRQPRKKSRGTVTRGEALPVTIPEPDPDWHPLALELWDAVLKSGQSGYYQQTDWAVARDMCEELSVYKSSVRRNAQIRSQINAMMDSLMLTEGSRRRVRVELVEHEDEAQSRGAQALVEYRRALGLTA